MQEIKESNIRQLRIIKNKTRLITETNKISKKQKTSENTYISIRDTQKKKQNKSQLTKITRQKRKTVE